MRMEDGDELFVCIEERYHSGLLHEYSWSGKGFSADGRPRGKVMIPVKDWNRLAREGRITTVDNQKERI